MRITRIVCLFALACTVQAAELKGYLMDRMCSAKAVKEGVKAAQAHTKDCALMPDCVKAGYGVFLREGKFIAFDAEGNKKAEEALKAHKGKDNLRVVVDGEVTGDTMKVTTLKLL